LAKDIGVPAQRIGDIVAGKRAITADTDLRLCRYFGLSDGWWLRVMPNAHCPLLCLGFNQHCSTAEKRLSLDRYPKS
jgi:hypothetical protein